MKKRHLSDEKKLLSWKLISSQTVFCHQLLEQGDMYLCVVLGSNVHNACVLHFCIGIFSTVECV